mgnify:CR=1 FL=1
MYIKLSRKAFEVRQMQAADTTIEISMGFNNKDCEPWTLFQIGVLNSNKDMTPNKGKLIESTLKTRLSDYEMYSSNEHILGVVHDMTTKIDSKSWWNSKAKVPLHLNM